MPWPPIDWRLALPLLPALGAMQLACSLLARGLGQKLERRVALLGLALPLLLLAPWLDGRRLLVPSDILVDFLPRSGVPPEPGLDRAHDLLNDAVFQFLPWELEVRHAFAERRLPLWSDLLEGGSSPWLNPQAGVLSPIALPARLLPVQHYLLAALALKLLVAFEGAWLLARRVGASRAASLLAGGGFALGGGVLPWALFPHTAAVVWVPWLAAGTIGLFREAPRTSRLAPRTLSTGLAAAALLYSGHPETAAIGGLFAAACGVGLRRRRLPFAQGLGRAALAALLGAALAAPVVLPFALHLPATQRAQETLGQAIQAHRFYLADPRFWFLPGRWMHLLAPTNPHAFGRPFQDRFAGPINWLDAESGYAGLVAFAGAAVALLAARDRRARPFLGFAALAFLTAAQFLPIVHFAHAVRPLRTLAYTRFLLVGALALALAGALGVDRLLGRRRGAGAWIALALAAAVSLAVHRDPRVLLLWALLGAAALAGLRRPRWGAAGLAAVLLLDLVPWGRSFLPRGRQSLFYPEVPAISSVWRELGAPGGPWRATGEDFSVFPSLLPVYGVAEVRPHNPLAPVPYLRVLGAAFGYRPTILVYFAPLRNVDHPLLDFLNVRVLVSNYALPPPRTLERIDHGELHPLRLYRNPEALPRWFVPAGVDLVPRPAIERWIGAMADPRRVALFPDELAGIGWHLSGIGWHLPPVRLVSAVPGDVTLEVPGAGERLLATSIPEVRGWSAEAAGRPLATLTVDGAFLGVRIPAGASRVRLRYRPPGLVPGLWAGAAGLALAAGLLAGGLRRAGRPVPRKRSPA